MWTEVRECNLLWRLVSCQPAGGRNRRKAPAHPHHHHNLHRRRRRSSSSSALPQAQHLQRLSCSRRLMNSYRQQSSSCGLSRRTQILGMQRAATARIQKKAGQSLLRPRAASRAELLLQEQLESLWQCSSGCVDAGCSEGRALGCCAMLSCKHHWAALCPVIRSLQICAKIGPSHRTVATAGNRWASTSHKDSRCMACCNPRTEHMSLF